jgi:RNA polymerase sigma factor (TIGR02999 family)
MADVDDWEALIAAADAGSREARDRLFAALYDELKRLARRELARGAGPMATLSATTLVHEAYAGMAARKLPVFPDKSRFMAYMARAMRGLIIDSVREKQALKRGSEFHITRLDTQMAASVPEVHELDRLSEALDALAVEMPALAELVDLKYFCGLTLGEIAAMRGISERTAQREWEKARLLLFAELNPE